MITLLLFYHFIHGLRVVKPGLKKLQLFRFAGVKHYMCN